MDKLAKIVGDKVGDMVEGAVKSALGGEDKDKTKDKGGGGFLSMFGGDKKKKKEEKEKDKGGIFSFGHDKKEDKDKGGFFSKVFDKDDDEDKKQKKSGFEGLFAEGEGPAAPGGNQEGGAAGIQGDGGTSIVPSDRDLFDDLLDVANENSGGK